MPCASALTNATSVDILYILRVRSNPAFGAIRGTQSSSISLLQNPSHSHLRDEVYQLPTPPQTVYSPSSHSETSDSDSTITDIASPPNLDGLFSMGKNVDNSSVMSPEEAAKHSKVDDIKQEEKEGCIAWTDPMGNVHWLRALVRPAISSVVSFAPLNFIDAGMLVGEVSHTDLYKPSC